MEQELRKHLMRLQKTEIIDLLENMLADRMVDIERHIHYYIGSKEGKLQCLAVVKGAITRGQKGNNHG